MIRLLDRSDLGVIAALVAALLAYLVLSVDQGQLFSLVQGQAAFDTNFIHEFVHDARHAAGFPCH